MLFIIWSLNHQAMFFHLKVSNTDFKRLVYLQPWIVDFLQHNVLFRKILQTRMKSMKNMIKQGVDDDSETINANIVDHNVQLLF